MYENIEKFYEQHHYDLIESNAEGSLRPCKSVPKDGEAGIGKFRDFRKKTKRDFFDESEIEKILGSLEINTITQNLRIMREFGFLEEESKADGSKRYRFTQKFISFVDSGEDVGCMILDKLYSLRSLSDFTMYLNFLLCVLREAAIDGYVIAYPDADNKFQKKVKNASRRKFHRTRIYKIYGFLSRGKKLDDEYTPNISYYCQAELKRLNLLVKDKSNVDGMDVLVLTSCGHHLLKKINENLGPHQTIQDTPLDFISKAGQGQNKTEQIIYYGVPGCGKSHEIEAKIANMDRQKCPRVVFHPEYTNTDFVGQILPTVDSTGDVSYEFTPGPFTTILLNALANPGDDFVLIIEEINRGNASAIFGEVFQLLDRKADGTSKYTVVNRDVIKYVDDVANNKVEGVITTAEAKSVLPQIKSGLFIPKNLSILATMNTSDQNVFTLDNAFQRRFDMKLIKNKFAEATIKAEDSPEIKKEKELIQKQINAVIPKLGLKWSIFQNEINTKISELSKNRGLSSMEDKRIGCWFVKNNGETESKILDNIFANKVLKYLWDDAFKFDRDKVFASKYDSLESLIAGFENNENIFITGVLPSLDAKQQANH